jgi:anti-anti-sigma regulatory factor
MGASESDCLSIQQEECPEGTVLHVSGEMDLSNAELLRDALEPIIGETSSWTSKSSTTSTVWA